MPSKLNNLFKIAVTGIMIFILGSLVAKYRDELTHLKNISPAQFALITILIVGSIIINGMKLRSLAGSFKIKLTGRETLGLSSITTSLNNFFFKAGSLFTSNYLKKRYEFPFMSFAGSQGADVLISFFINAFIGLAISVFYLLTKKGVFITLALGYLSIVIVLGLIFSKTFDLQHRPNKYLNALIRAINSLYRILKNKKLFFTLCLFNILIVTLNTLRFFLVCKVLGVDIPIGYCLLFISLLPFISTLPFFQSDIGTRELILGVFSQWLGAGFEAGMLATLLDRCFIVFTAVIISLFFQNLMTGINLKSAMED
ncbi:MAG: lysylphosphatidylglycerol synthase domain-containing protein [Nitrospinota bacterium]